MKTIFYCSLILFIVGFSPATLLAAKKPAVLPQHPTKIKYDSLDWEVPLGAPYRTELKNGCIAYIAEDSQLPLIKTTVYLRHGGLADPKGKVGLSSLLATMLRAGGTKKFPADTLDELIDLLALKLHFSAGETQFTFKGSFLSEYGDNAFTIIKEMFFSPVFDKKKLEKEKKIQIEAIKHRFDNPGPTLSTAYQKLMYPNQAASRLSSIESIKKITRQDLINLHQSIFTADNCIFCIAGAFNRDSMKAQLEQFFPAKKNSRQNIPFPKVTVKRSPGYLIVHKEISQAYVRIGLPLFQRPHPDYYPMSILNHILGGGGFTSRLGKTIRSDAGLTYSIYSTAESNYTYPSTFYINFFTKNQSFAQAVALTIKEVRKFIAEGVTDDELKHSQSSLIGELPSMFRSPTDIVATYGWNEYYHRAPDHFRMYPEKIKRITRDDLQRVAKQYLHLDSMTVTVVGDTTALLHQKSDDFSLANLPHTTILPEGIPTLP